MARGLLLNIKLLMAEVESLVQDGPTQQVQDDAQYTLKLGRDLLQKICNQCYDKHALWLLSVAIQAGIDNNLAKLYDSLVVAKCHPHKTTGEDGRSTTASQSSGSQVWDGVLGQHLTQHDERAMLMLAIAEMARLGHYGILHRLFGQEQPPAAKPPDVAETVCWSCVKNWFKMAQHYEEDRSTNLVVAIQMARLSGNYDCLAVILCHCIETHASRDGPQRVLGWQGKKLDDSHMERVMLASDILKDKTFASVCQTSTMLNVSHNRGMTVIPRLVKKLALLTHLDLSTTHVGPNLTREVFCLPRIIHLNLSDTLLYTLPADIHSFSNSLQELLLADNKLNEDQLPPCLAQSNITYLDLSRNKFTSIPLLLCGMTGLRRLHLSGNKALAKLPDAFGLLALSEVKLGDCSLPDITVQRSMMKSDWEKERDDMKTAYYKRQNFKVGQVAVIGRACANKTRLISGLQAIYKEAQITACQQDLQNTSRRHVLDLGTKEFFSSSSQLFCCFSTTFIISCSDEDDPDMIREAFDIVSQYVCTKRKQQQHKELDKAMKVLVLALADANDTAKRIQAKCEVAKIPADVITSLVLPADDEAAQKHLTLFSKSVLQNSGVDLLCPESFPKIQERLDNFNGLPLFISRRDFWDFLGDLVNEDVPDDDFETQLFIFLQACGSARRFYSISLRHPCVICTNMVILSMYLRRMATNDAPEETNQDTAAAASSDSCNMLTHVSGVVHNQWQEMLMLHTAGEVGDRTGGDGSIPWEKVDLRTMLMRLLSIYNLAFLITPQYWYVPLTLDSSITTATRNLLQRAVVSTRCFKIKTADFFTGYGKRLLAEVLGKLPDLLQVLSLSPKQVSIRSWKQSLCIISGDTLVFAVTLDSDGTSYGEVQISTTAESYYVLPALVDLTAVLWQDEAERGRVTNAVVEQRNIFSNCRDAENCSFGNLLNGAARITQCQAHCPGQLAEVHITEPDHMLTDVERASPEAIHREHVPQDERIGAGCYGEVFRYRDAAIKVFTKDEAGSSCLIELRREWSVLRMLQQCCFVVQVRAIGTGPERIVLSFAGRPMDQFMSPDTERPSRRLLQKMIMQMYAGVSYIHGHNVLHRDLKPSNILVTSTSEEYNVVNIKLIDFGSAITAKNGWARADIGALLYRPPEMIMCLPQGCLEKSAQSDVFSLGTITLELIAGEPVTAFDKQKNMPNDLSPDDSAGDFLQAHSGLLNQALKNYAGVAGYVHLASMSVKQHAVVRPRSINGKLFACSLEAQLLIRKISQHAIGEPRLRITICTKIPPAVSGIVAGGVVMATREATKEASGFSHQLVRVPLAGKDPLAVPLGLPPWKKSVNSVLLFHEDHKGRLVVGVRGEVLIYAIESDGELEKEPLYTYKAAGDWPCMVMDDNYIYVGSTTGALLVMRKQPVGRDYKRWFNNIDSTDFAVSDMAVVSLDSTNVLWIVLKKGIASKLIRFQIEFGLIDFNMGIRAKQEVSSQKDQFRKVTVSGNQRRVWISSGSKVFSWDTAPIGQEEQNGPELEIESFRSRIPWRNEHTDQNYVQSLCCINGVMYVGTRHGQIFLFNDNDQPDLIGCLQAHHLDTRHLVHVRLPMSADGEETDLLLSCGYGNGLSPIGVEQISSHVPLVSSFRCNSQGFGDHRCSHEEQNIFDTCFLKSTHRPPLPTHLEIPDAPSASIDDEEDEGNYVSGVEGLAEGGDTAERISVTPSPTLADSSTSTRSSNTGPNRRKSAVTPVLERSGSSDGWHSRPGTANRRHPDAGMLSSVAEVSSGLGLRSSISQPDISASPQGASSASSSVCNTPTSPLPGAAGRNATKEPKPVKVKLKLPRRPYDEAEENSCEFDGSLPLVVSTWEALDPNDIQKLLMLRGWIIDN